MDEQNKYFQQRYFYMLNYNGILMNKLEFDSLACTSYNKIAPNMLFQVYGKLIKIIYFE